MDGTGNLFLPLLRYLKDEDIQIVTLPNSGNQDYISIVERVEDQLPTEDYIIVAESFSGPLGALLAKKQITNMKGIVFVATFLSPPSKLLLKLSKFIPVQLAIRLPGFQLFLRHFLLGYNASKEAEDIFIETIKGLDPNVIRERIGTVQQLLLERLNVEIPSVYIQAEQDKLIPFNKGEEFRQHFTDIEIFTVKGPHFILQSNPSECASLIIDLKQKTLQQTK